MENKKWKRFGSCLMALAMVLSGTALPASAATPGKDGSAEMNEAYAAHESLMPIGPLGLPWECSPCCIVRPGQIPASTPKEWPR